MTPQQKTVFELLKRFPKAGTRTVARMAYKQNPTLWKSEENARDTARNLRGSHGAVRRRWANPEVTRPLQKGNTDPFLPIPEGKTHFVEWGPVQIQGPINALVFSDVHIPYHSRDVVETILRYGMERGCDTIILNGDLNDFFSISHWQNDPRKRDLAGELRTSREFFAAVRSRFPKARIIHKEGNHEERWVRYLSVKAPEILGVEEFDIPRILRHADYGVEWVGEMRPIRLGGLNVIHGHEYRFPISNPVNPARGLFNRAKTLALCGHMHQSSNHNESNMEGKIIGTWSLGCCFDLHPDYRPLNNWNHGFATVEVDRTGEFQVENKKIIHGRVFNA